MIIITNVIDALEDHSDALDAHAEGVTSIDFGIDADRLEDLGIDHTTAHDFEPLVAKLTKVGREEVHLEAGFGEGKEAGTKACLGLGAEDGLHEVIERGFEIEERDVFIDIEAFDLVEVGAVGGVGCVAAEATTGRDDADRWLLLQHGADLHGRSMGA